MAKVNRRVHGIAVNRQAIDDLPGAPIDDVNYVAAGNIAGEPVSDINPVGERVDRDSAGTLIGLNRANHSIGVGINHRKIIGLGGESLVGRVGQVALEINAYSGGEIAGRNRGEGSIVSAVDDHDRAVEIVRWHINAVGAKIDRRSARKLNLNGAGHPIGFSIDNLHAVAKQRHIQFVIERIDCEQTTDKNLVDNT